MNEKARLVHNPFDTDHQITIARKTGSTSCSLHCHEFFELEFIVSGLGKTILNGNVYPIGPGVLILLTPLDFHEYHIEQPLTLYSIKFTQDSIDSAILDKLTTNADLISTLDAHTADSVRKLCNIMYELDPQNKHDCFCSIKLLEALLVLHTKSFDTSRERIHQTPVMQKAVVYIHAHFKENPSLSDVASLLHLNPRYFCTLFNKYAGMSYKNYLRNVKLDYAARLIKSTNLSITEIATESGYGSLSHFNREFHSFFEMTPLAMRKKQP